MPLWKSRLLPCLLPKFVNGNLCRYCHHFENIIQEEFNKVPSFVIFLFPSSTEIEVFPIPVSFHFEHFHSPPVFVFFCTKIHTFPDKRLGWPPGRPRTSIWGVIQQPAAYLTYYALMHPFPHQPGSEGQLKRRTGVSSMYCRVDSARVFLNLS